MENDHKVPLNFKKGVSELAVVLPQCSGHHDDVHEQMSLQAAIKGPGIFCPLPIVLEEQ